MLEEWNQSELILLAKQMHFGLSWRHETQVGTRACGWSWMDECVCLTFGMLAEHIMSERFIWLRLTHVVH